MADNESTIKEKKPVHFIALLEGTREGWPNDMTDEEIKVMQTHFKYLVNLMHDGKMLLAGPSTGLGGVVVLEVADEAEARELMDKEPSVAEGVHTYTLYPFVASLLHGRDRLPTKKSEKRVEKETVVAASLDDVWNAWTTSDGWEAFFVEHAEIELKPGGKFEIHFDPGADWGSRGSEGCRVLSFVPKEMISFTWNAPPTIAEERLIRSQVAVFFKPVSDSETRVRLIHHGFNAEGRGDEVYEYFNRAWGVVLQKLTDHFDKS